MIASAHIAAGLVVGMGTIYLTGHRTGRVIAGFTLGLLSHVVLDAIPHGDYGRLSPSQTSWVVLAEVVMMIAVGWSILRTRVPRKGGWVFIPSLAGAVIPDAKFGARLVLPPNMAERVRNAGDRIHGWFHATPLPNHTIDQALQIVTTIVLIALLARFPSTRNQSGDYFP